MTEWERPFKSLEIEQIEGEIQTILEGIIERHENDIIAQVAAAEIYKAGTEGRYDGQAYLQRIASYGRSDLKSALRNYRGKLEKAFGKQVKDAKTKSKSAAKDATRTSRAV